MSTLARYAKLVVGVVGLIATLAVTFATPDTMPFRVLSVILAAVTLTGQGIVPNARSVPEAGSDLLRAVLSVYGHRAELVAWLRETVGQLNAGAPTGDVPPLPALPLGLTAGRAEHPPTVRREGPPW